MKSKCLTPVKFIPKGLAKPRRKRNVIRGITDAKVATPPPKSKKEHKVFQTLTGVTGANLKPTLAKPKDWAFRTPSEGRVKGVTAKRTVMRLKREHWTDHFLSDFIFTRKIRIKSPRPGWYLGVKPDEAVQHTVEHDEYFHFLFGANGQQDYTVEVDYNNRYLIVHV